MNTQYENLLEAYKKESRAFCPNCEFLKSRCLCDTIKLIDNKTKIVILQHKTETKHALNTARILLKSLHNVALFIGEDFTHNEELNQILENPQNKCALIFPGEDAITLDGATIDATKGVTHLIMIDGTWRKARKIYYLSKNLHSLLCLRLVPQNKSQYRIRKSPSDEGLSTLEATVESLKYFEPQLETKSLELSFKKMIDFQIEKMGEDVYRKNYTDKRLDDLRSSKFETKKREQH